jgi:hypothetical protein
MVLLLTGCAPTAMPQEVRPQPPPPVLPLVVEGPAAAAPRGMACTPEEALLGPITAASGWGHASMGCRTGPSPREVLAQALRRDGRWRRCLEAAGVRWLDGSVRVSPLGQVVSVSVTELEPETAEVRACLQGLTHHRLLEAGCELDGQLHFARLE